jgi:DNA-binding transcriptional LysR family regulator
VLPKSTLEQWAVLATVIDAGSFANAAATLNRSQSAVSYSVSRLQEAIGLPLLSMAGRRAVLTVHGVTLLARARVLLRDLSTLESLAAGLKQGWEPELQLVVDVAFPRTLLLQIIGELQQSCPNTQVQLSDVVLSGAEEAITQGIGQVVISSRVPAGHLGDWLLDVNFVAVAHPDHALVRLGRALTTDDLIPHVQSVVRDSGVIHPRDDGWLGARHRYTVSSMEASLATVQAGLAYAWLPEHMLVEGLRDGKLRRLTLALGGIRKVSLYLVAAQAQLLGPAASTAVAAFRRYTS